ncbi:MAG TPA: hypothetical protein VF815_23285 [Myxococcaceae bacterium]
MPSIRNLLCAALVAGVLFSAPSAEARFGKRSDSSEKNDKEHEATAVGEEDSDDDRESSSGSGGSYAAPRSSGLFWVDLLFALFVNSSSSRHAAPSGTVDSSSPGASPLSLRFGADGAAMGNGVGLGAFLGIEGQQWGVEGRALALVLPTDDGTVGTDTITLTNVHLTLALVSMEKARFRVEGGFSSAHAPDLTVVGPSMALSLEACLAGPFDLEMRLQATPYPYRQLEGHAGMAVHLNALVLRGGWRGLFLDDNGLVDGVPHSDAFSGPYLGLGFTF